MKSSSIPRARAPEYAANSRNYVVLRKAPLRAQTPPLRLPYSQADRPPAHRSLSLLNKLDLLASYVGFPRSGSPNGSGFSTPDLRPPPLIIEEYIQTALQAHTEPGGSKKAQAAYKKAHKLSRQMSQENLFVDLLDSPWVFPETEGLTANCLAFATRFEDEPTAKLLEDFGAKESSACQLTPQQIKKVRAHPEIIRQLFYI